MPLQRTEVTSGRVPVPRCFGLACLGLLLLVGHLALAGDSPVTLSPIPIDKWAGHDFLAFLTPDAPVFAPDGQFVAFLVTQPSHFATQANVLHTARGVPTRSAADSLWVQRINGSLPERVTPPNAAGWAPAWSSDGKKLAYFSDQSGDAGLWIWSREQHSSHLVFGVHPAGRSLVDPIIWVDPRHVLVTVRRERSFTKEAERRTASESAGVAHKGI